MDLNLRSFLIKLGYPTHKIPPDEVLNDLTRGRLQPVFEDLISKYKSKQEVNKIRDLLLYNKWKRNEISTTAQLKRWKQLEDLKSQNRQIDAKLDAMEQRMEKLRGKFNLQAKLLKGVADKQEESRLKILLQKKIAEKINENLEHFSHICDELKSLHIEPSESKSDAIFNDNYKKFTNSINFNQIHDFSSTTNLSSTLNLTHLSECPKLNDDAVLFVQNNIIPNFNLKTVLMNFAKIMKSFKLDTKQNEICPDKLDDADIIVKMYDYLNETLLLTHKYNSEQKIYNNHFDKFLNKIKEPRDLEFIESNYKTIGLRAFETALDEFADDLKTSNSGSNENVTEIANKLNLLDSDIDKTKCFIERYFAECHAMLNSIDATRKELEHSIEDICKTNLIFDLDAYNFHEEIDLVTQLPLEAIKQSENIIDDCFVDLLNSVPHLEQNKILDLFPDAYVQRPEIILIEFLKQLSQFEKLRDLEDQEHTTLHDDLNCTKNWQSMLSLIESKKKKSFNSLKEVTVNFQTLKSLEQTLKNSLNFWLNQEMKVGVSSSRMLDNKPLMYYDEMIRKLYIRKTKDDRFLRK